MPSSSRYQPPDWRLRWRARDYFVEKQLKSVVCKRQARIGTYRNCAIVLVIYNKYIRSGAEYVQCSAVSVIVDATAQMLLAQGFRAGCGMTSEPRNRIVKVMLINKTTMAMNSTYGV